MDLQALYDLKERLEHAAIAGTGLLQEDFRLKRAVETLAPLAAAIPVFGKIASAAKSLLSAPAEGRGKQLLDVLALVDAVAYTQGTVNVPGDLTPIEGGGGTYVQAPYSDLHPLLTALTTTGGGRMEVIQSALENHPERFTDFRVLPVLIADLGDSYGELAELNVKILKQAGSAVLPLLKQGFDPAGKRDMGRRVEVISAIEGARATPWLREILPEAKKDVRMAVLLALGNDPDNIPLLLELAKTERSGANRDAVLMALSKQDGDAVQAFWAEELVKNPGSVLFLQNTETAWSGELVASGLRTRLERMLTQGDRIAAEENENFSRWCQAVGRKTSSAMLDFWRWADGHMEPFDELTNEKGNPVFVGVRLTNTLGESLRLTGPGPLRDFCLTLFDRHSAITRYLSLSFHASLLCRPAAEVYAKFAPYVLTKQPLLNAERKKSLSAVLLRALGEVYWDREQGCHILTGGQPTAEPLDRRWFDLLMQAPDMDVTLRRLTPPDDQELCARLEGYLYRRLMDGGRFIQEDVAFLRKHGWTQWKGFLDQKVRKDDSLTAFAAIWLLNATSLTGPEKAAELRNLVKIVEEQSAVKKRPAWPALMVQKQIASWEAE